MPGELQPGNTLLEIQVHIGIVVGSIGIYVWQFGGCWRSAKHHIVTTKRVLWPRIVQATLILGLVLNMNTWSAGAPLLAEYTAIATRTEPYTDYTIAVLGDGEEIAIDGAMAFGLGEELGKILEDAPNAWLLHLTSTGGRLAPARRVALEMKTAGFTYREIAEQCRVSLQVAFNDVNMLAGEESAQTEAIRERNRAMEDHGISMLRRELLPVIRMEFGEKEMLTAMERRKLQQGAIGKWIQSSMRRSKLLGLDMQTGADDDRNTGNRPLQGLSDEELHAMINTLSVAVGVNVTTRELAKEQGG